MRLYITALLMTVVFAACLITGNAVASKQDLTIEEIEEKQDLNDFIDIAEDVMVKSRDKSDERYIKCLKSFGHTGFCGCIQDELPGYQSFDSYFFIITTDKNELNYSELEGDDKSLIDSTHKARDVCVGKAFKKH